MLTEEGSVEGQKSTPFKSWPVTDNNISFRTIIFSYNG
jgi:hypothetical protein